MKKIFVPVILFLLLVACSTPEAETVTVRETVISEVPVTVEVTREVETEVEVTRVVEVEVTAESTATLTPGAEASTDEMIARNYGGEAEVAGINVQVARVLIANKDTVPQDFSLDPSFDSVDVVGEVIFIVTNNSDKTVNVHPFQGSIQINQEVIEFLDYFLAHFGDDIGNDIPPGAQLIGGQWFGVNRNEVTDVAEVIIRFSAPSDSESFQFMGDDFEFAVDFSERVFEPIPKELQDAID